jgi:branched-chain amino acid transport system permease protein
MTLVNAIVQGVFLGAYYAVLACGLSIMFGVMRTINLAHGDVAVFGAYVTFLIVDRTGASAFVAFAAAVPVMLVLGYILQLTILERSLKSGILTPLLATFGLSIVIQNLLLITFSPDVRSLGGSAGAVTTAGWHLTSDLSVSALGVLILAVAVAVFTALHLFLSRTRAGWAMRATAEDADAAELVGINSRAVHARATAIAVAVAALGGLFLAIRSVFDPVSGPIQLIFAFEAVVIGGMGSLWGTLVGGIALGVAQTIGAQIHPQYAVLAGHVLFLTVLIVRYGGARLPSGFPRLTLGSLGLSRGRSR